MVAMVSRSFSYSFTSDNPSVLRVDFRGAKNRTELLPPAAGINGREVEAKAGAAPATFVQGGLTVAGDHPEAS